MNLVSMVTALVIATIEQLYVFSYMLTQWPIYLIISLILYAYYPLLGSVYSTLIYYYFCMPFTVSLGLSIAHNFNYLFIMY